MPKGYEILDDENSDRCHGPTFSLVEMPCVGIRGGDEPKHETIILTKGRLSITKVALQRHGTTVRIGLILGLQNPKN